jgi:hypothetical protein
VLSLVIGGQQPYAIDPDGPLVRVVTEGLVAKGEFSDDRKYGTERVSSCGRMIHNEGDSTR